MRCTCGILCVVCVRERLCVWVCGSVIIWQCVPVGFVWGQQQFLCVLDPNWRNWLCALHIHTYFLSVCEWWKCVGLFVSKSLSVFMLIRACLYSRQSQFAGLIQVWEHFYRALVCDVACVPVFSTWSQCQAWHSCRVSLSLSVVIANEGLWNPDSISVLSCVQAPLSLCCKGWGAFLCLLKFMT